MMVATITTRSETDLVLLAASESLDLSETQYRDAVSKYGAVGAWLEDPKSNLRPYAPMIFPQGSFVLGTCVRPIGKDEFDIDLVCELNLPPSMTQKQAKDLVGTRLAQHDAYGKMLEEKNRCWRLNYAGQFHMDILPAKPDEADNLRRTTFTSETTLLVPDRNLRRWKASDPVGYARWFALRKEGSLPSTTTAVEAVEPVPDQETSREKRPLQIAVQLLKRHRDLYFNGRDDAPISIIITTLAGKAYEAQTDILSTMAHLVATMPTRIEYRNGVAYVLNPTNEDENFADRWATAPEKSKAFFEWIDRAKNDISSLRTAKMTTIQKPLANFLGDNAARRVLTSLGEKTHSRRASGVSIRKSDGRITPAGAAGSIVAPRNTFYGGNKNDR